MPPFRTFTFPKPFRERTSAALLARISERHTTIISLFLESLSSEILLSRLPAGIFTEFSRCPSFPESSCSSLTSRIRIGAPDSSSFCSSEAEIVSLFRRSPFRDEAFPSSKLPVAIASLEV